MYMVLDVGSSIYRSLGLVLLCKEVVDNLLYVVIIHPAGLLHARPQNLLLDLSIPREALRRDLLEDAAHPVQRVVQCVVVRRADVVEELQCLGQRLLPPPRPLERLGEHISILQSEARTSAIRPRQRMRRIAKQHHGIQRSDARQPRAREERKLLRAARVGNQLHDLADRLAELVVLAHDLVEVERPAPADVLLAIGGQVDARRDLEVVVAERRGEDVLAAEVLPEGGRLGDGVAELALDGGLADDGAVGGLAVVLDLVAGEDDGADDLGRV
jgi:hypothetical protein